MSAPCPVLLLTSPFQSPPTGVAANTAFPYGGQSTTQAGAEQNMNLDIKAAILSALNQLGVSAVGYSWTVSGYTPLQCLVRENNGIAVGGLLISGKEVS